MTSAAATGRIFWKEYRQQRGYWFAMLALGLIIEAGVWYAAMLVGKPVSVDIFAALLVTSTLYALGSGAVLFAGEHDAETYLFLRSLPVPSSSLTWGKFGYALTSLVALPMVLAIPAAVLWYTTNDVLPEMNWTMASLAVSGGAVICLELFGWASLFSLRLRHPMWAVLAAFAAAFFSGILALPLMASAVVGLFTSREVNGFEASLPLHALLSLLLVLVNLQWSKDWQQAELKQSLELTTRIGLFSARAARPPRIWTKTLRHLAWQEYRLARVPLTVILGTSLTLGLISWWFSARISTWPGLSILLAQLPVVAAAMGGCVFLGDQGRNQFRYFAERGIGGRTVWLSRQLVWLSVLVLWALIVTGLALFDLTNPRAVISATEILSDATVPAGSIQVSAYQVNQAALQTAAFLFGASVLAYCSGQLAGVFMKSPIISFFLGLVAAGLTCGWASLISSLGVPFVFSVAPLPLLFLWITWLRAADWVVERATWPSVLKAAASFSPLLFIVIAVVAFRVVEIPPVPSRFPQPNRSSPANELTKQGSLYHDVWKKVNAMQDDASQVRAMEDQFIEAGKQGPLPAIYAWKPSVAERSAVPHQALATAVLDRIADLREPEEQTRAIELYLALLRFVDYTSRISAVTAGKIETQVLNQLPEWVVQRHLDAPTIHDLAARIRPLHFDYRPLHQQELLDEQRRLERVLDGKSMAGDQLDAEAQRMRHLAWLAPWEVARARRLVSFTTESAVAELGTTSARSHYFDSWGKADWWRSTTLLGSYLEPARNRLYETLAQDQHRSAIQVILAIQAYQAIHGNLPPSLAAVQFKQTERLPIDPLARTSFDYAPKGYLAPLPSVGPSTTSMIGANLPFIWGYRPSPMRAAVAKAPANPDFRMARPASGFESGVAYPIPQLIEK